MVQSQMETRDQQIERLQSALDQSQQLQALTESRFQAKHMQLAGIRSRSFLQRLKAFEWLNLPSTSWLSACFIAVFGLTRLASVNRSLTHIENRGRRA